MGWLGPNILVISVLSDSSDSASGRLGRSEGVSGFGDIASWWTVGLLMRSVDSSRARGVGGFGGLTDPPFCVSVGWYSNSISDSWVPARIVVSFVAGI